MARKKSTAKTEDALHAEMPPEAIGEFVGRRVKKMRNDRGWSLEELAQISGVSRSFRIARAFGLSLQELISSVETAPPKIQVIRSRDRGQVFRSDRQCEIRTLSPLNLEKDVEFYEVTLRPGGALRSQPHFEGTREFLTVEDGLVQLESDGATETLGKGDSGTYPADVPHAIINAGPADALVFLVVIYR